jgi:hypothetical protein
MHWIAQWCGSDVVVQPELDETGEAAMPDWRDWAETAGLGDGAVDEKLAVFILHDPGPAAKIAERTLVLVNLSLADRRRVHDVCHSVCLEHHSEGPKESRTLVVTKPKGWIWSQVLPRILSPRPDRISDAKKRAETLRATHCDVCKQNSADAVLLCSETSDAVICSACLQVEPSARRNMHIWQRMRDCM